MTGFAQVKAQLNEQAGFRLALKSVNHRFLDLHLRMPADSEGLEMKIRRALQARLHRGHVECTLSLEQGGGNGFAVNHELVGGYIAAFRSIAKEFGVVAEPDVNAVLKIPGALETSSLPAGDELESTVLGKLEEAITRLDEMRAEEGRGLDRELRERMQRIEHARGEIEKHSSAVLHAYMDKVQSRMQELVGAHADRDRILQEASILADRSDIREELVRLHSHVGHFLGLLDKGGEVGKKLDFLLQEMAREANTLLSKTSGVAGEALRITEMGLMIKSEIEKAREQAQNVE